MLTSGISIPSIAADDPPVHPRSGSIKAVLTLFKKAKALPKAVLKPAIFVRDSRIKG